MRTDPPFVIPDAFPENEKTEPIEEKQKIRRELPEKDRRKAGEKEKTQETPEKKKNAPPPDPFGQAGGKIDVSG